MVNKPWVLVAVIVPFVAGEVAVASSQPGIVAAAERSGLPSVADPGPRDRLLVARRR